MSSQLRTDRRLSAGSPLSLSGPETGSASGLGPGAYSVPYTGLIRDETVPNSSRDSSVGPGPGAYRVSGPSDHHSTPSVVYDIAAERHDRFVDPPSAETPLVRAYLVTELPLVEATLVVSSQGSVRKRLSDARRLLFARKKKDGDYGDDGDKSDDDEDETEEGVDEDEDDDDTEDEENDDNDDDSEDAMDRDSNDGSVFEIIDSSDDDDDENDNDNDNEFRPETLQGRIDPASHYVDHKIGRPLRLQEADVDAWEQKRKHKVSTESSCETLVLKSREKMKRDSGVRNQDERSTNDTSFPIDRTRYSHGVQRPGRSFFQRRSFLKFYKERQECAVALVVVQNTKTNECGACSGFVVHKRRGLTVAAAHLLSGHVDETTNRLFEHSKLLLAIPDEKDSDELVHFYAAELVACDFKTDVCILRNLAGSPFSTSVRELKLTEKKCRLKDPVLLYGFSQDGEGLFDPKSFLNCQLGVQYGNVSMLGKYGGATPIGPANYVPHEEIKVSGTPAVPGHSGGPCINDSGEVVGILCRVKDIKDYPTVWYIIPCSQIRKLLDEAEARGNPQVGACESPPVARSRRESFFGLFRFGGLS
jgi:Trypsin-like peptidase domain